MVGDTCTVLQTLTDSSTNGVIKVEGLLRCVVWMFFKRSRDRDLSKMVLRFGTNWRLVSGGERSAALPGQLAWAALNYKTIHILKKKQNEERD